jgi:hypothetical protein
MQFGNTAQSQFGDDTGPIAAGQSGPCPPASADEPWKA